MIKLIPDWKKAWKFASVQINTIGIFVLSALDIIQQSWNVVPVAMQSKIPYSTTIAIVLMALGIVGRLFVLKGKD